LISTDARLFPFPVTLAGRSLPQIMTELASSIVLFLNPRCPARSIQPNGGVLPSILAIGNSEQGISSVSDRLTVKGLDLPQKT
jgi:hypothetical protein